MLLQVSEFGKVAEQALLLREGDWVEAEGTASLAVSLGHPPAAYATERLAAYHAHLAPPIAQQVTRWPPSGQESRDMSYALAE